MPMNKNMLSPLGFNFFIKKLPEFNFFVQSVTIPGINLGYAEMPNPFKTIPIYGDHATFGELTVAFKINEDLGNYIEIYDWITGLAFPKEFSQYSRLKAKNVIGEGVDSDAYLMIMSSNQNPIMKIEIEDLFPVSLSDITMDARDTSLEYVEATVSFKFKNYKFTAQ